MALGDKFQCDLIWPWSQLNAKMGLDPLDNSQECIYILRRNDNACLRRRRVNQSRPLLGEEAAPRWSRGGPSVLSHEWITNRAIYPHWSGGQYRLAFSMWWTRILHLDNMMIPSKKFSNSLEEGVWGNLGRPREVEQKSHYCLGFRRSIEIIYHEFERMGILNGWGGVWRQGAWS